jgi:glycosyltransferase involved in cell wall biosynthesis
MAIFMGSTKLKLSIVIPTRDRATCLKVCLQTATQIESDEIEIIVSDNASTDNTKQVIEDMSDPRIKYVNTGKRVSMRENFDNAVNHCTGDYVFTMGDDDGILPKQIPAMLTLLEKHKPDVLCWHVPQFLWYPDEDIPNKHTLRIRKSNVFGTAKLFDADRYKTDLLACRLKLLRPLPALYHGCASRTYLDSLRSDDGVLYNSAIHDYYMSYLFVLKGGRFLNSNHTFSVSGASPMSTGGDMNSSTNPDAKGSPGQQYRFEVRKDVKKEPFDTTLGVSIAVFGALETARLHLASKFGNSDSPDYGTWYSHVLYCIKDDNPDTKQAITKELQNYAQLTQTESLLAHAKPKRTKGQRSLSRSLKKLMDNLTLKRLCTEEKLDDNILTAVNELDNFLGQDHLNVLNNKINHSTAWRNSLTRSKNLN